MINIKASLSIRLPSGKFPRGSYVAALRASIPDLVADVNDSFAQTKDPWNNVSWPPRRHDYPHPPLADTGRMFKATIEMVESATIVGSTLSVRLPDTPIYAKFQYFGTKHIAARRFMGVSARSRRRLAARLRAEGVRIWRTGRVVNA